MCLWQNHFINTYKTIFIQSDFGEKLDEEAFWQTFYKLIELKGRPPLERYVDSVFRLQLFAILYSTLRTFIQSSIISKYAVIVEIYLHTTSVHNSADFFHRILMRLSWIILCILCVITNEHIEFTFYRGKKNCPQKLLQISVKAKMNSRSIVALLLICNQTRTLCYTTAPTTVKCSQKIIFRNHIVLEKKSKSNWQQITLTALKH